MKQIKLSKGAFSLVDDEDFEWLSKYAWKLHKDGYAVRTNGNANIYMHREVNRTPVKYLTDHINRDKLDNQKVNLRTVNHSQNSINTGMFKHNTSGIKGVTWHAARGKWQAQIKIGQKNLYLGVFQYKEEAEQARKKAELIYHGT